MSVVLTNLSNRRFEASRHRLNASARKFGIDTIRSYDFDEIRMTGFYRDNRTILDQPTGIGFWLWKPYIILEALNSAADGDIVIYADSGIEIIASLEPLLAICREGRPILLFGNGNLPNSMWTKRDCFVLLDADDESYWKALQCDAAFCIFQRGPQSLQFVTEWLRYCRDPRILTNEPNTCGKRDLPDFIEHRRDQSVLSLLARKHRLPLFRMPTQFGNHYKDYPYRVDGEFNCVSQARQQQVRYYAPIPYYNSLYPQLLDHHRTTTASTIRRQGPLAFVGRVFGKRWRRWRSIAALRRELRKLGQTFHPEYWQ